MFAGQDKNAEGKQNYSSYVEFNYPFCVKMVDLNATCGIVPYAAPQYNCDGFAVTNVALKGTTRIRFNDTFALPIFAQAVVTQVPMYVRKESADTRKNESFHFSSKLENIYRTNPDICPYMYRYLT
jgi:hypothetical protein